MKKRKPGRPCNVQLITLDEGVDYIKRFLKAKYPHMSKEGIERCALKKKTLYNYRASGRLQKYGSRGFAMVDKRELEKLVG